MRRPMTIRRHLARFADRLSGRSRRTAGLVLAAALAAGCSQVVAPIEPPIGAPIEAAGDRVPVVLVPGITGTGLRDPATGKLVWGNGAAVIRPHDGGYALAKPIRDDSQRRGGRLEPTGVMLEVRLGPIRKEVYGPIVELLEGHGYRLGDLESPRPATDLFLFAYDWRDENAVSAARLANRLESLRRARGEESLAVDLVCQSNGAHVCRWFAKYGGASLEEAEAGVAGSPRRVRVRKLILVSSSNGGSIRNLVWLTRGRRYLSLIGRRWSQEAIFTIRAIYEDLPVFRDDLFIDSSGEQLAVDLFDVESWRRYGWSIFSAPVARRIERSGRDDLFGDAAERQAFLGRALDRARRFHRQLRRDVAGFAGVSYYMIQNVQAETPLRAVLTRRGDRWRARFLGDRWLRRRPELERRVIDAGDGHATAESQLWLTRQERLAMVHAPARVDGNHFELILEPEARRRLLAYLEEEPVTAMTPDGTGGAASASGGMGEPLAPPLAASTMPSFLLAGTEVTREKQL
jgi:hypothetical protein